MKQSFKYPNAIPQNQDNNRGIWLLLEAFARNLLKNTTSQEEYIVSGPLFLPNQHMDGRNFVRYQASVCNIPDFKYQAMVYGRYDFLPTH